MSIYDCGMKNLTAEVVVVGGGPAGLTTAIALAGAGVETVLVAGRTRADDNRTTALLAGSVTALEYARRLGALPRAAAPLRVMRIVDATARLIRAPEVRFDAQRDRPRCVRPQYREPLPAWRRWMRGRATLPALSLIEKDAEAVATTPTASQ